MNLQNKSKYADIFVKFTIYSLNLHNWQFGKQQVQAAFKNIKTQSKTKI
jgi:hypothetical protein